jgi:hypothetical protein
MVGASGMEPKPLQCVAAVLMPKERRVQVMHENEDGMVGGCELPYGVCTELVSTE